MSTNTNTYRLDRPFDLLVLVSPVHQESLEDLPSQDLNNNIQRIAFYHSFSVKKLIKNKSCKLVYLIKNSYPIV